jgi:hypothetical protein
MRVVTMALMDASFYLTGLLVIVFALTSYYFVPLAYVAALGLLYMFVLLFLSIPLKLNWSSNLYGHLFRRFVGFLFFLLLIYAVCFYMVGFERADGSLPNFAEAIYFSVTTFTTLQYGEYRPLAWAKPLAALESLMSIMAFVPFFAAYGWLYCQHRLWPKSLEHQMLPKDLKVTYDDAFGVWREIEDERTKAQQGRLEARLKAFPCARCGADSPKIEKIFDIVGRTTPLPQFIVHCSCGQISKPSTNAFMAVWRWKMLNKRQQAKKDRAEPDA